MSSSNKGKSAAKANPMEWPTFLHQSIQDVIRTDFQFKTMTPVQVIF